MIERLPELVNGDEALVRRGRYFTDVFMIEVGDVQYLVHVRQGRIDAVERGPFVMRPWRFALRASAEICDRFWQKFPDPGYHDIFALLRKGEFVFDGDLQLLFRLGFAVGYTDHSMSLKSKIRIAILHVVKQNTLSGSKKNIAHHYDVGNEFYRRFLGPTMAYTCAYYETPDSTLEEAQTMKVELACRKLRLRPGDHIAELGCGWGGFLIHAAQNYGITGVGVTLSKEQADYGASWIADLGLQDRIRIEHKDYREIEGTYDKVASIGMMEHVGIRFVPGAFKKINDILRPADPWFDCYIFPGGQIPPLSMLIDGGCDNGMNVVDVENLRLHYELTLFDWIRNFTANEDWIREQYDDTFCRMYRLYLEVCASSFRYGDNRLFQVLFTNGLSDLVPLTRSDLYMPS